MVLDELLDVVTQTRTRIKQHGTTLRENETRTRVTLIDPLLRVLGWDVSNPDLVTLEARLGSGSADYALLAPDSRSPAAVIEAKRLGENLAGHREQMVGYCVQAGVAYAALTNGDQWLLYDVWSRRPLDEKQIFDVSLANGPDHEVALRMLPLLRPNLVSTAPVTAVGPAKATTPQPVQRPKPSREGGWIALTDCDPPGGSPPPSVIQFPDGDERPLGKWNRVLIRVAEKLHEDGHLTPDQLPIARSKQRNLAARTPVHRNGKPFFNKREIAKSVFIEVNVSARDARNLSERLLARFGIDPRQVRLRG